MHFSVNENSSNNNDAYDDNKLNLEISENNNLSDDDNFGFPSKTKNF